MSLDLNKRYQFRTPAGYFEGDKPGEGTLEDVWLNTDTHAWVARVNTEALLIRVGALEKQHVQDRVQIAELVKLLRDLTDTLKNNERNG